MSTSPLPPKRDVALALCERTSIFVHLDPRRDGVVVPPWFRKQPQLVLQVGLNMAVPIPDLRFDEDGLSCTLSFNRSPFFCVMPWSAIFALVGEDGRGMVWPDDVPPEVQKRAVEEAAKEPLQAVDGATGKKKKREKPRLVALKNEARDEAERRVTTLTPRREGAPAPAEAKPAPKGGLREVPASEEPKPLGAAGSAGSQPAPKSPKKKAKRELPPYLRVVK